MTAEAYHTPSAELHTQQFRIGDLIRDRRVQRDVDPSKLGKMLDTWDRRAVGAIVVSARADGTLHIIDGSHRVAAMNRIEGPDAEVDGVALQGLTIYEEAGLFRHYNRQKPATALDLFRVRLIEQDVTAYYINEAANAEGWTIGPNSGQISSVSTLETIYNQGERDEEGYGYDLVRDTLNVLTAAWGNTTSGVTHSTLLRGVSSFLLYTKGYDIDKTWLAKALGHKETDSPKRFLEAQKQIASSTARDTKQVIRARLHFLYNKGKKGKRLPDLEELAA